MDGDIPAEVRHAAETQYMIRPQVKSALEGMWIDPKVLIAAGHAVDPQTKDYWTWWSKRHGDRFFDMGTAIRLAGGLETGLRDYFGRKRGFANLTNLSNFLAQDKRWRGAVFQRIFPRNSPKGARELFQQ